MDRIFRYTGCFIVFVPLLPFLCLPGRAYESELDERASRKTVVAYGACHALHSSVPEEGKEGGKEGEATDEISAKYKH